MHKYHLFRHSVITSNTNILVPMQELFRDILLLLYIDLITRLTLLVYEFYRARGASHLQTRCLLREVHHGHVGEVYLHQGLLNRLGQRIHTPQGPQLLGLPHAAQLPPKL